MGPPPRIRMAIMVLLASRRHGLSAAQMAEKLALQRESVDRALIESRRRWGTEHFRIASYRRQRGTGGREIPVYKLGPGPDAKRPELGEKARAETRQRYADENRDLINRRNRESRRQKRLPGLFNQLMRP